jgi:hypothetical protein
MYGALAPLNQSKDAVESSFSPGDLKRRVGLQANSRQPSYISEKQVHETAVLRDIEEGARASRRTTEVTFYGSEQESDRVLTGVCRGRRMFR